MKTYEELKAMTAGELVNYAMELQESIAKEKENNEQVTRWWTDSNNKLNALKNAIINLSQLV